MHSCLLLALKIMSLFVYWLLETDVEHYDHYWVIGFAHGTMQVLLENILKIQELTPHSTRQLVADIGKCTVERTTVYKAIFLNHNRE